MNRGRQGGALPDGAEIVKNHCAEYVLVGPLISTLIATLLGMLLVHAAP